MKDELDFLTLYLDEGEGAGSGDGDKTGGSENDTGGDGGNGGDKSGQDKSGENDRTAKKYSEDDVDKIVQKKIAKERAKAKAEADEAAKLAKMDAQERAEHERDKYKAELDELKRANARAEMEKTARGILQTDGVNVPDAIVATLVGDDADATSENVKAFSNAFKDAVQAEVKAQLSHKKPNRSTTGGAGGTITRQDIEKEEDYLKRQKLMEEHPELYPGLRLNK